MENNEQPIQEQQSDQESTWSIASEEEIKSMISGQEVEQPEVTEQYEEPVVEPEYNETPEQFDQTAFGATTDDYVPQNDEDYEDQDIESAVMDYLSERLGYQIDSLDDFNNRAGSSEIDERIEAIANFVSETGRNPEDWFYYQRLDPSEMDDMTAIQVQMASDYPNLSQEELTLLMSSKYKLDPNEYSEEEVRLSQLQLKLDAQSARADIEELRESYRAPEGQQYVEEDLFDDEWIAAMEDSTEDLDGIEFDLGNGQSFAFGIGNQYKNYLADKNVRLDEYFDPYVREDGSWDYDKLNMHQTVIDNIDMIVKSVYQQGMSDGQRGIVNQAANVRVGTPNQGGVPETNSISQQLRDALSGGDKMRTIF